MTLFGDEIKMYENNNFDRYAYHRHNGDVHLLTLFWLSSAQKNKSSDMYV